MAKHRDILLGMAEAGIALGNAPLLINNNWAKVMMEDHLGITSTFDRDPDAIKNFKELKRIARKYIKARQKKT